MFLFIDTSQNNQLTVALISDEAKILEKINLEIKQNHSEKLSPAIEEILRCGKIDLKNLRGIGVVRGPGSFTGVRVGVACANALGFALNISVKGVKYQEGKDLVEQVFKNFPREHFSKVVVPFYL